MNLDISTETIIRLFRLVLIGGVTSILIGTFLYALGDRNLPSPKNETPGPNRLGLAETAVFLGLINALFLIFIGIQVTYLFGGAVNITQTGFTYAEYAHHGFAELIIAAFIAFVLILITERQISRQGAHHNYLFQGLSIALAGQTMVIMISAFLRLSLYEEAFGFTILRLYSHLFIIWLAIVFSWLIIKIWISQKDSTFSLQVFVTSLVFLMGINIFNLEGFIARKNIERYAHTGKLDADYLSYLSDDAVPVTIEKFAASTGELRFLLANQLAGRQFPREEHWQSFNLARTRAQQLLRQQAEAIEHVRTSPHPI